MKKLNAREKYAALLLAAMGLLLLGLQIINLLSTKSNAYSTSGEGNLVIHQGELLADIRTYVTVIACLAGSFQLFRVRTSGWIIAQSAFTLVNVILISLLVLGYGNTDRSILIAMGILLVLPVLATFFLWLPSARKKYMVSRMSYVLTILLLAILSLVYTLQ